MVHPFYGLLAAICSLGCAPTGAGPSAAAPSSAPTPARLDLLVKNVRVFDGQRVWPTAQVGVRDGRVVSLGVEPGGEAAEVVDGVGMTLMPGLIDAHTHIHSPASLRLALRFGVTTELDMFTGPGVFRPLRSLQRGSQGKQMADFRSAGILVTAPGGHGTQFGFEIPTITAPAQAQAFVDARLAEGSDYIKIVHEDGSAYGWKTPTIDVETLRAVVTATHAREKLAVVHVSSLREATAALEAGADGLAHVFFDAAPTAAFVQMAARRGVFVTDTLTVIFSLCDGTRGAALAADPLLAPLLGPGDVQALQTSFHAGFKSPPSCDPAVQAVRELHAAGVTILASTDAPNPGTLHGVSMHDELVLLVQAGLTPVEALTAATSAPARRFALTDRGVLAPGKRADMLLVRGDATTDIRATRAIVGVWKQGVRLDLAAQRDAVAQEHAALAAKRAAPAPAGSESGRISDFETGEVSAAFGAGWQQFTDAVIGGSSTVVLKVGGAGAANSKHGLQISGTVADGNGDAHWAGAMFQPGAGPMQPANLARFKRVQFWARAARPTALNVLLYTEHNGVMPGRVELALGPRWTRHTLTLAQLGAPDAYDMTGLFFGVATTGPFAFEIDDIRLE